MAATKRTYYIRLYHDEVTDVPYEEIPYSTDSIIKLRKYALGLKKRSRTVTIQINTGRYNPKYDPMSGMVGQIQFQDGKQYWVYMSYPSYDIHYAILKQNGTIGRAYKTHNE